MCESDMRYWGDNIKLSAALLSCPHQGTVSAAVRFPEDNLAALRPQLEGVNPGEILNYNRAAVAAQYERSSPRFEHPNGGQFPTKVSWRDRKTSGDQQHWKYRSQDDIRLRPTTSDIHWGHEPSPDLAGDATVEFFKSIPVSEGPRDGISPISPSPMVTQSSIPRASNSYIRGNTGRPQTSVEVIRSQEVEVKDFWQTPPGSVDNHRAVSGSVNPQNTRPFRNTLDTWTPFSEASSNTQHFLVPPHSDSDGDLSYPVDTLDTSPFRPRTNPPSPRPVDSSTMFITPAPNEAPRASDEELGIPSVKPGAPYEAPGASYGEPPTRHKSTKRPSLTTVLVKKDSLRPPKESREPSHFTPPHSQSGPSFWKHTAEMGFPSVPSQRDPGNHIFVESDVDLDMSASSNDHSVRWELPPPPQEVIGNSSRDSPEPWIEEHLKPQVADPETHGNSSTPLLSPKGPSSSETTERGDQSSVTLSQSEQNKTRLSGVEDETPPGNTTHRPPLEHKIESKDTQSGEKAEKPSRGPLPVREYNESLMIGAETILLLASTPAPPGRRPHKEEVRPQKEVVRPNNENVSPHQLEMRTQKEVVRPHMEDMRLIKEDVRLLKEDVRLLKEDMRPHKEEVKSYHEDVSSHKEDVMSHKEEVSPPKEEVIPHKEDVRPQKEEMRQNKEKVRPYQEEVRPFQEEVRSHH